MRKQTTDQGKLFGGRIIPMTTQKNALQYLKDSHMASNIFKQVLL